MHSGKDLAVSIPSLNGTHPEGCPLAFATDVSVRTSRLAADGRYPLPCCMELMPVFGLSSIDPEGHTAIVGPGLRLLYYTIIERQYQGHVKRSPQPVDNGDGPPGL